MHHVHTFCTDASMQMLISTIFCWPSTNKDKLSNEVVSHVGRLEEDNAAQRRELESLRAAAAREARIRFRGCNHPAARTAAAAVRENLFFRPVNSFSGLHTEQITVKLKSWTLFNSHYVADKSDFS